MNKLSKELETWINKQSACWKGYEQVGMKMLDGREVPNCVPASKDIPNSKPKKKKTEKKSNENNLTQFFADVPIVCTPGLGCKRQLTENEIQEVIDAQKKILPNLFPRDYDRVSSMMSNPEWAGIGTGLLGALGGGAVGGLGAHLTNRSPALYGLLAAALGGLGGGLYGYIKKKRKNSELEDLMKDLPVGGDIGDIEVYADPKMTAAVSRDFQRQLIRKGL
jgi:hypothetical protein